MCSFGIHASVLNRWRREALYHMEDGFKGKSEKSQKEHTYEIQTLHAKIGELTVQNDFLVDASKRLGLGGGQEMIYPMNFKILVFRFDIFSKNNP